MMKRIGALAALLLLSAHAQAQTVVNWLTFPIYGTITAGDCVSWHTSNASGVAPSVADAGAPCGTGSGGAFSSLTSGTNTAAAMVVGTGSSLSATGTGTILATNAGLDTCADASGSTTAYVCTSANGQATTNGKAFLFKPQTTNTASATLTINGVTWTLKKQGSNLLAGDVIGGQWYVVVSDGVFWQVSSRVGTDGAVVNGAALPVSASALATNSSGQIIAGSAGGGGTVTTSGTPASGNLATFSGATAITNGNLSGDVTTSGTLAATVVKVNGAAVPASAAVLASNSSSQLVAASTTGSGNAVLATSPTLVTPALGTPTALVLTNATGTPTSIGLANGTGLPLTGLATQATNTLVCNATSGSASPTACSAANAIGVLNSTAANAQTGTTYTPVLGDANLFVTMNNASANTFCIPPNSSVAYAVGTTLTVEQIGAGVTTVAPAGAAGCAGSGVTVTSLQYGSSTSQTYALAGAFDLLQIRQTAANIWFVTAVGPGRPLQSGVTNLASTAFGGVINTLPVGNGGTGAATLAGANIPVFSGAITSGHCVEWLNSTTIEDAGAGCGSGGSTAFSALTGSTNTTAAMVVGTGASLATSGTGTITATSLATTLGLGAGGTGTTGVTSVSTATSITPNCTFGMAKITASATGTFTLNAPGTCTPFDGQKLTLKVTSPSGGTITYSWNAAYLASATLALPTTSNAASKEDYFAFQYDSDKSGWVFLASNQGF